MKYFLLCQRYLVVANAFLALAGFGSMAMAAAEPADSHAKKIVLCTTFPIYQIARNIAKEREGIEVQLMLPAQLGCPHDYALTPQDMAKLAKASVLVINGLGMEEFLGAPTKKANPRLVVIDSSEGIEDTLAYAEDEHGHGEHGEEHAAEHDEKHGEHDDRAEHHHEGVNPHLFASPRMTAKLAQNIAAGLAKVDPEGADLYSRNAQEYAEKMNKLAEDMAALGKRLANNRIVQPHGIFDYLARDMGLEIVAIMQPHGQEPSAAEMNDLAKIIKEKKVGAIFVEPQYPDKIGKTLAKETGAKVALLDPCANGPENAPLDYYEKIMCKNMETLAAVLGEQ